MDSQSKIDQFMRSLENCAPVEQIEAECSGLDLNQVRVGELLPLWVAANVGSLEAVKILVRHGALVNGKCGFYQDNALHQAALNGHAAVADYLISCGVDVDVEQVMAQPRLCVQQLRDT